MSLGQLQKELLAARQRHADKREARKQVRERHRQQQQKRDFEAEVGWHSMQHCLILMGRWPRVKDCIVLHSEKC